MEDVFKERLHKNLLIWLDDILAHATTFEEILGTWDYILQICEKFGLKLNAKKTIFFATEVKFCGKILSEKGVKHDPKRTDTLSTMAEPTTVGELQQFLCALNWMRASLPDFP